MSRRADDQRERRSRRRRNVEVVVVSRRTIGEVHADDVAALTAWLARAADDRQAEMLGNELLQEVDL